MRLWTVGHSNGPLDSLVARLKRPGIAVVADVRRFPGSRRHPHFSREQLAPALALDGLEYTWLPELGGRRRPRPDSPNTAWRNASFRGYADYMATPAFEAAVERLIDIGRKRPTAALCAELLWWQCHRALIADYLKSHGHEVLHITGDGRTVPHPFTSAARLVNGCLQYSGSPLLP